MARRACAMTLLRAQMASIMRPADGTPQQVWAPSREKTFSLSSPKPRPKLLKTHHSPDPEDTSGLDHTALYTAGFLRRLFCADIPASYLRKFSFWQKFFAAGK